MPTARYLYAESMRNIDKTLGYYVTWKFGSTTREDLEAACSAAGISRDFRYVKPAPSVIRDRAIRGLGKNLGSAYRIKHLKDRKNVLIFRERLLSSGVEESIHAATLDLTDDKFQLAPLAPLAVPISTDFDSFWHDAKADAQKMATPSDLSACIVRTLDNTSDAIRVDRSSSKLWFVKAGTVICDQLRVFEARMPGSFRKLPVADTTEARKSVTQTFEDAITSHIDEIKEAADAWDGTDPSEALKHMKKFREVKMKIASAGDFYSENVDKLNKILELATDEVRRKAGV